ncbi:response regulator [Sphingobacterium chuzhouense]|uniref:Response regulator n=1 Tax=Sphingobacterium chuzhouense TaxID=1742264 RepID=A0ABR7XUS5_9SPHI|nr:response regulator [Sphingobacterium chuzhouense]MBD1422791.1 response regulator [Sphingobacterium chuzhouense]
MNKKLKLVLVDDEPEFIDYVREIIKLIPDLRLKKATTNPIEALTYLLKKRVDILLLDIDMPLLNGFQLMNQIQHLINPCDPSVPPLFVVLCSGYTNNPEDCFKSQAADYIQKPLTLEKLIETKIAIQQKISKLSVKESHRKDKETFSEKDLVTVKEAEDMLQVSRWKITKMRDNGELTTLEKDGQIRLLRTEVEEEKVNYSVRKGKI